MTEQQKGKGTEPVKTSEPAQTAVAAAPATPGPETIPNTVTLPAPYGVAEFHRPDRAVKGGRGGELVTRVLIPIPGAGIVIQSGIWRNERKGGGVDYSVSLPSYVVAAEPVIDGTRDNDTTGAVKDAIVTAWLPWFKAIRDSKPVASTTTSKPTREFGRVALD